MRETEEKTVTITESEYNAYKLLEQLSGFGSRDIASAAEDLKAAGIDEGDFAEWIEEKCKGIGSTLQDIDICAGVYQYILIKAREEYEELTGKELNEKIYVYGNYCATDYDNTSEAKEEIEKAIKKKKFDIENASELFKWFYDKIS